MRKVIIGLLALVVLAGWTALSRAQNCPFVSSQGAKEYHKADCPLAQKIKTKDKICYNYPEEVISAGKGLCNKCKPEEHTKVTASKKTDKYHIPGCTLVKYIKPENRLDFVSPEEAAKAGYPLPCVVCKPPKAIVKP